MCRLRQPAGRLLRFYCVNSRQTSACALLRQYAHLAALVADGHAEDADGVGGVGADVDVAEVVLGSEDDAPVGRDVYGSLAEGVVHCQRDLLRRVAHVDVLVIDVELAHAVRHRGVRFEGVNVAHVAAHGERAGTGVAACAAGAVLTLGTGIARVRRRALSPVGIVAVDRVAALDADQRLVAEDQVERRRQQRRRQDDHPVVDKIRASARQRSDLALEHQEQQRQREHEAQPSGQFIAEEYQPDHPVDQRRRREPLPERHGKHGEVWHERVTQQARRRQ